MSSNCVAVNWDDLYDVIRNATKPHNFKSVELKSHFTDFIKFLSHLLMYIIHYLCLFEPCNKPASC